MPIIQPQLLNASFVFARQDGHVPPLSPLYHGPCKVFKKSDKFFRLQVGIKEENVSIDRLKAVVSSEPVLPTDPPKNG